MCPILGDRTTSKSGVFVKKTNATCSKKSLIFHIEEFLYIVFFHYFNTAAQKGIRFYGVKRAEPTETASLFWVMLTDKACPHIPIVEKGEETRNRQHFFWYITPLGKLALRFHHFQSTIKIKVCTYRENKTYYCFSVYDRELVVELS